MTIMAALIIYLLLVFLVTFIWSRKISHEDFFVHKRKAGTFLLTLTALSTAIGGGTIFTLIQFGYVQGLSAFIICAAVGGGLFFAGFFGGKIRKIASEEKLFTLPEFLEKKFDSKSKKIAALVNLLSYLFLAALQLLALATIGIKFFGINPELAFVFSWAIVVCYTYIGGLKSDIVTDALQFVLLSPIVVMFLYYGLKLSGGFQFLKTLSLAPLPGGGINPILLAIIAVGVWMPSIIGSMDLWQRIYAAKSEKSAKNFLFFSGIFLFFILFLFSFSGIIFRGANLDVEPALIPVEIISLLPATFSIIVLIGLLAAIMSTGDSMLMVLSATWTHDIYKSWKNVKEEKKLLRIGRYSVVFFGLFSLALAMLFPNFVQLLGTALSSLAILTPSVIGGLYTQKLNKKSAFWSILSGFIILLLTLIITIISKKSEIAFLGQLFAFLVSFVVFLLLFKRKEM